MTTKITETQKFQLLKAIDDAQEFEKCRYANEAGQPVCVIGQLFRMVDPGIDLCSLSGLAGSADCLAGKPLEKAGFDYELLARLQNIWDSGSYVGKWFNEASAREQMRQLVEECEVSGD